MLENFKIPEIKDVTISQLVKKKKKKEKFGKIKL